MVAYSGNAFVRDCKRYFEVISGWRVEIDKVYVTDSTWAVAVDRNEKFDFGVIFEENLKVGTFENVTKFE